MSGTTQVSYQVCQFFCQFCVSSCACISRTTRFTIQKSYMELTLRLFVVYELLPCTALTDWFFITEAESVYCEVRIESLHKTDTFYLERVNSHWGFSIISHRSLLSQERTVLGLQHKHMMLDNPLSKFSITIFTEFDVILTVHRR